MINFNTLFIILLDQQLQLKCHQTKKKLYQTHTSNLFSLFFFKIDVCMSFFLTPKDEKNFIYNIRTSQIETDPDPSQQFLK